MKKFGQLKKAFTAGGAWQPILELFKHIAGYSQRTIYAIILSISDERARSNSKVTELAYEEFTSYQQRIHELLGDDGVLILPSSITAAPFHHGVGRINRPHGLPGTCSRPRSSWQFFHRFQTLCSPTQYFGFAGLINILKLPGTVVPMGLSSKGIPLSVQIIAGPRNDRLTLAIAKRLEAKFGGFIPPFEA